MHILIVLNDPPYGTERSYNGLRLAKALGREDARVTLFLLADAVVCANRGQKVPQGFYNVELMLNSVIRKGEVLLCGSCMDARGVGDDDLVAGARRRSSMKELGEKTLTVDKVLVF
ncbi:MAG: DsrE family protein [Candidatus Thiodiazotropha sp. (ex Lucina aurantia)]|nr:DsrE family protein [Candidatus Thiodiazotropha sp. (ex Lucina pensylvanica)]MBT3022987.1 DsrE family protein [Candidatus Thiodiazotropha taylori]MBV2100026.1 DsrE family protein [Candidatus Thiodiazotropha sp. (ex Codakia orbicularis)]MBV2102683.1 DsrE family protein [Candidatus Thiodiazotropha sp. (ex Lucina aurantia)]MBV2117254.1 DsrE family protein [Candidatus Thiodiazotropha sp. (ex Lucina aurantia)]